MDGQNARPKSTVEPAFGQVKEARGFRPFLLRGLEAVTCDWSLVCLPRNVLELHRSGWTPGAVRPAPGATPWLDRGANRLQTSPERIRTVILLVIPIRVVIDFDFDFIAVAVRSSGQRFGYALRRS